MTNLCCNPLHVYDDDIDMQLEQVWDLQRKRSKGGRGTDSLRKGRLNFLNRKNLRGGSLQRNQQKRPTSQSSNERRTMSTGRPFGRSRSPWGRNRGRSKERAANNNARSKSPWGRNKADRRVSISKYVERIDTRPVSRGSSVRPTSRGSARPMSRGRGDSRPPPPIMMGRGRSSERRTTGLERRGRSKERKSRSRSWSLGRRKKDRQTQGPILRVRTRSKERRAGRPDPFNDNDSHHGGGNQKRGFFRRRSRERRQDQYYDEESSDSSASEETAEAPGFFGF